MLTIEDCIELCGLTEDEIDAIARHEHLPEINAAELARYLVQSDDGTLRIRRMIVDDLADAKRRGDTAAMEKYRAVLGHFIAAHPVHARRTAGGR
ncbi:MAG: hypothetical protein M5U09_07825 [Gammaproteobacteria bacterium]|nr:hypothetical protein [Gammaproteobacteria bacterium]